MPIFFESRSPNSNPDLADVIEDALLYDAKTLGDPQAIAGKRRELVRRANTAKPGAPKPLAIWAAIGFVVLLLLACAVTEKANMPVTADTLSNLVASITAAVLAFIAGESSGTGGT